jgi:holliday junction DNA helicase RuvA
VITSLRGTVLHVGPGEIVLEVGGVGLRVAVPASVLEAAPPAGGALFLHTRLLVREEALSLVGFSSTEQRALFDLLLEVPGVGARLALAVISNLTPEMLQQAVGGGQSDLLTRVPGIGRKTAEKIAFLLRDRLPALPAGAPLPGVGRDAEVVQALVALGYSQPEAQAAVQALPHEAPEALEERLVLALRSFSRP